MPGEHGPEPRWPVSAHAVDAPSRFRHDGAPPTRSSVPRLTTTFYPFSRAAEFHDDGPTRSMPRAASGTTERHPLGAPYLGRRLPSTRSRGRREFHDDGPTRSMPRAASGTPERHPLGASVPRPTTTFYPFSRAAEFHDDGLSGSRCPSSTAACNAPGPTPGRSGCLNVDCARSRARKVAAEFRPASRRIRPVAAVRPRFGAGGPSVR